MLSLNQVITPAPVHNHTVAVEAVAEAVAVPTGVPVQDPAQAVFLIPDLVQVLVRREEVIAVVQGLPASAPVPEVTVDPQADLPGAVHPLLQGAAGQEGNQLKHNCLIS